MNAQTIPKAAPKPSAMRQAQTLLGERAADLDRLRPMVRSSWLRSIGLRAGTAPAPAAGDFLDELETYRRAHPLAAVMPVITKLLVEPAASTGLLVAVGDEHGNLLWVEGDADARRGAELRAFAPGMDWSERVMGTSAPGTALATDTAVQISREEHLSELAHVFNCTAVPLHDPDTGAVIGIIDITGRPETESGSDVLRSSTLMLVQATVAAAEAELRIARLTQPRRRSGSSAKTTQPLHTDTLQVTGRERALLSLGGRSQELSLRHSEILTLLARHRAGLSGQQLAELLSDDADRPNLRAELVRLRRVLNGIGGGDMLLSTPYRLARDLTVDADQVGEYVRRGAHRLALNLYAGAVLPPSQAPGVVVIRQEVSAQLRESMLADAGAETLLAYLEMPEAANDAEAWRLALELLPARSPKRAAVVAHLQRLETQAR